MPKENKITFLPFDLYDFFGYIMPGLLTASTFIAVIQSSNQKANIKFENIKKYLANLNETPFWIGLVYLSLAITILYLLGHILATFSSIIIDKFFLNKIAGYPVTKLFKEERNDKNHILRLNFYKFIILFSSSLYVANLLFTINLCWNYFLIYLICAITIWKSIQSTSTEKLGFLNTIYWQNPKHGIFKILGFFIHIFYCINKSNTLYNLLMALSLPFRILSRFLSHSVGINESFPDEFIKLFKVNYYSVFKTTEINTNTYWLCYLYVCEKSEHSEELIKNWLRLYSFMRNLSTSFLISSFISIYINISSIPKNLLPLTLFGMFAITFIRYYYLYYNYYSKFIFRSFFNLTNTHILNTQNTTYTNEELS